MSDVDRKEQFQYWLAHMDDALDAFIAGLPEPTRSLMDATPESLDALEALLLSRYVDVASAKRVSEATFIDGAARYVGEVLRKASGGNWAIELKDTRFVFFGLPILKGGTIGRMPECPLTMVTASLDRRIGTYLSSIVASLSTETTGVEKGRR